MNDSPTVGTSSRWSAQPGPITRDDPFAGTTIDWRLWTADNWQPLQLPNFNPVGTLLPMNMPEPVLSSTVTPVNMTVLPDGHVVYDMGVNLVGVCALSLQGPDGAMVTLKVTGKSEQRL